MTKATQTLTISLFLLLPAVSYAHESKIPQGEIGIKIEKLKGEEPVVTVLIKGGPADLKGVLKGDVITHIDGTPTAQMPDIAEHRFKGDIGSSVHITIRRDGVSEPLELKINRWQSIDRSPKPPDLSHPDPGEKKEK